MLFLFLSGSWNGLSWCFKGQAGPLSPQDCIAVLMPLCFLMNFFVFMNTFPSVIMLGLSMCLGMQCNSHSEAEQAAWQWHRICRLVCNRHPWKNANEPHTGWMGKYSTAGKLAECNKWKLLLHLDSTGCQLFSASAWQSSPAPNISHATCFPVLDFHPSLWLCFLEPLVVSLASAWGSRGGCCFQTYCHWELMKVEGYSHKHH